MGIKPTAYTPGHDHTAIVTHLNESAQSIFGPAGANFFFQAKDRIGERAAVSAAVALHPEEFETNLEVIRAKKTGIVPDLVRLVEKTTDVQRGILLGYSLESTRRYNALFSRNPYGMNPGYDYHLKQRIQRNKRDVETFNRWRHATAQDWLEKPIRTRLLRGRVHRMMQHHLGELIREAENDPELRFIPLYLHNSRLRTPEEYFKAEIEPYYLDFLSSGYPFRYRQHVKDRQGFNWLKRAKKALQAVDFDKRLQQLQARFPEEPGAKPVG